MTKRLSSKHKIDRRLGLNLWGRPKSPFNRRPYGPGQHGQARRRKPSDFGIQLAAKQKLKKYYGDITEKQFLKIYQAASRKKGDTSQILIELLERRLDAVVFRLKFAPTVFSARQLVNHGHVLVNGKVVNKKSVKQPEFVIILGNFYSLDSAKLLKKRVKNDSELLRNRKITILKKNKHNFEVFLGPYNTIKMIKNDYIALRQINFDEVDVKIYE